MPGMKDHRCEATMKQWLEMVLGMCCPGLGHGKGLSQVPQLTGLDATPQESRLLQFRGCHGLCSPAGGWRRPLRGVGAARMREWPLTPKEVAQTQDVMQPKANDSGQLSVHLCRGPVEGLSAQHQLKRLERVF